MLVKIVEPDLVGHHLNYLKLIIDSLKHQEEIYLTVITKYENRDQARSLLVDCKVPGEIKVLPCRWWREVSFFYHQRCSEDVRVEEIYIFPYADRFWLALLILAYSKRCRVHTIFMRLDFIYFKQLDFFSKIKSLMKYIVLNLLLLSQNIKTVWYADKLIKDSRLIFNKKINTFSEPIFGVCEVSDYKPVSDGKHIVSILGSIGDRKEVFCLIDMLLHYNFSDEIRLKITGKVHISIKEKFYQKLSVLIRQGYKIDIIDDYVSDEELFISAYESDIIWLVYNRHYGPSGILEIAKYLQKKIISRRDGYIGSTLHNYDKCIFVEEHESLKAAFKAVCKLENLELVIDHQHSELECFGDFVK